MARPFKWELNVQTGERKQIELTDEEIALAESKKAEEDAAAEIRNAENARKRARQNVLDVLLDKMIADPTLIDRIG